MASFACKHLELRRDGHRLTVVLNRPEVKNAFNAELIDELHRLAGWIDGQEDVRLVFLRGNGSVFCAGGDLNWMKASLDLTEQENIEDARKLSAMLRALDEIEKPVIGLVHGAAIGGGVGLVSICDHVIADRETVFSLSETRLGLIPAVIGSFVLAKIGLSHTRALTLSGRRFRGDRAYEVGLVHELVSGPDELEAAGARIARDYTATGPVAVATAKRFIREIHGRDGAFADEHAARTLAALRVKPEAQEGIAAFLERRDPSWRIPVDGEKRPS